jgi:alpha-D-ribose 1-methylphosphonate 5-triphosphate synthase subunit PhnH
MPRGLPPEFWKQLRDNRELFPLGVDLILASRHEVACLPRTIRVEG